jgi:hypothetical protein
MVVLARAARITVVMARALTLLYGCGPARAQRPS